MTRPLGVRSLATAPGQGRVVKLGLAALHQLHQLHLLLQIQHVVATIRRRSWSRNGNKPEVMSAEWPVQVPVVFTDRVINQQQGRTMVDSGDFPFGYPEGRGGVRVQPDQRRQGQSQHDQPVDQAPPQPPPESPRLPTQTQQMQAQPKQIPAPPVPAWPKQPMPPPLQFQLQQQQFEGRRDSLRALFLGVAGLLQGDQESGT